MLTRTLGRAADVLPAIGAISPIANAVPFAAVPLPLSAVRLTGGPLKRAQDLNAQHMKNLDMDRFMYRLRERAGLKPKAATGYGSWEGPGRQLTGAMVGHYLSAVSYMYAASGDPEFKRRVDYLVNEFKEVQDAQGDGYIGGLMANLPPGAQPVNGVIQINGKDYPVSGPPSAAAQGNNAAAPSNGVRVQSAVDGKPMFEAIPLGTIRSGGFDLNGMWSPWYVQHKLFAGLRDAYRQAGNREALDVSIKFAGWVEKIVGSLDAAQTQRMLATEFGGMNESLADLYADTGDKRWLALSEKFHHDAIVNPLAKGQDILGGKHGNTQVPKLIGELARYIYAGDQAEGDAAKFFWAAVVDHHSFATGGHGYDEGFGAPDKLSGQVDGTGQRSTDLRTCESCNVYNMVKMTRLLFALNPQNKYAEFQERALFNHILASISFTDGQVCYMVPVSAGMTHEYQGLDGMTCCAGSGLESHALHGLGLYYAKDDKLWVNVYAPSTAQWKEQGIAFTVDTDMPVGETATLKFTETPGREISLLMRYPSWAGTPAVAINGEAHTWKDTPAPGSHLEFRRAWKAGDTLKITLPKGLYKEALPDNAKRVALKWGPLVLAADLGPGGGRGRQQANYPVFLADAKTPVSQWLKPVSPAGGIPAQTDMVFHARGVGGDNNEVDFKPFYQLSNRRYGVYWDVYTPEEWAQSGGTLDPETQKRRRLEAATVAYVQPGQMQPERDYNFQGEDATVINGDTPGRWGTKWISFDVPVEPAHPMLLLVTYNSGDPTSRTFDILVDGARVKSETTSLAQPAQLHDVEYAIPAELVRGKDKVTIRFEATGANGLAAVYGLRMIRGDAQR